MTETPRGFRTSGPGVKRLLIPRWEVALNMLMSLVPCPSSSLLLGLRLRLRPLPVKQRRANQAYSSQTFEDAMFTAQINTKTLLFILYIYTKKNRSTQTAECSLV